MEVPHHDSQNLLL
ncbi:rCG31408 [Rattus norvegicus]|uniref:RCG31408 n=1 Tax=Rattus norvegicus TaxID=10116 RepID=A6IUM1_RAT|nr:rCG31408 [Rattus norvegicus]